MKRLLEVKDFSIVLKKNQSSIVHNLSFGLDPSNSLVLLGESGSGKTLTFKSILGVLGKQFSTSGDIYFEGKNLLCIPPKERQSIYGRQIFMIAQNPMTAFDPSSLIGNQMDETLRIHYKMNRDDRRQKCLKALRNAGLSQPETVTKSYPFMLSGGMLQRVMIASALMMEAKLIVADEPTTALDVENRNVTVDAFIELREKGVAILLVTHDFAVAKRFGGRLLVMNTGEIVERGTIADVLENPKHSYTKKLLAASYLSASANKEVY